MGTRNSWNPALLPSTPLLVSLVPWQVADMATRSGWGPTKEFYLGWENGGALDLRSLGLLVL